MTIASRAVLAAVLPLACLAAPVSAADAARDRAIDDAVKSVNADVVRWRRDFHEHPELSNEEVRTAGVVAAQLRALGLEVKEHVGGTGVVGVLRGGKPGPVVALRADMDALPVVEEVDVPFKSKARGTYLGQDVGIMHACGHDAHVAILLGTASVLTKMKAQVPGTVKFIFQPAEEGGGGAGNMIKDGVLEDPRPAAIFGLHVMSAAATGTIDYRPGGLMAASDSFSIKVRGSQTHGAYPWKGVDPIVVGAQIVLGLQTLASRQMDTTIAPVVVTVGRFQGGVRNNIIPDEVEMLGTLRTLDPKMRTDLHERVKRTAMRIAESAGATATVEISDQTAVTYNDPALTDKMKPTLVRVLGGADKLRLVTPQLVAEDFSAYQEKIPGVFVFLGSRPPETPAAEAAPNHSPRFFVDETALPLGVKTLTTLALDYLGMK